MFVERFINGFTEVEENDSNDTLACDDDANKVVLCVPSFLLEIVITNFTFLALSIVHL